MILPSAKLAPRFTMSQQAIPTERISGFGRKIHFCGKPGFRKIERNEVVGEGGNNIQSVVYNQRLAFVAVRYARRRGRHNMKILNVARVNAIERAEPGIPVITGRHGPLAAGQGRYKLDVGPRTGNGDRRAALCNDGHHRRALRDQDENELGSIESHDSFSEAYTNRRRRHGPRIRSAPASAWRCRARPPWGLAATGQGFPGNSATPPRSSSGG